ncbi:MAG: 16S rRNA (guanine(527)-N(7))-methyltransferase RsmG [Streptosporangiales bacterium]|nr:16S rRNA (guanine(527)-N(7))-methyltransferase RsmG [Streptosporangiales bacterium]
MSDRSIPVPPPPSAAAGLFGERLPVAEHYAALLATAGVVRGIIGPREVDRLWDRHLLNCAVVGELIEDGASVVDVGSGAGLPGVVLGIMRPDLSVTLLEPLLRRTVFLEECVAELGLKGVTVRRGRAEDVAGELAADVVTARAVAPLDRLARWGLPLLRPGGELLALKGERAEEELSAARDELSWLGASNAEVVRVGHGKVEPATTVVRVVAGSHPTEHEGRRPSQAKRRRRRKR